MPRIPTAKTLCSAIAGMRAMAFSRYAGVRVPALVFEAFSKNRSPLPV